jgi:predicted PurR-regulated permease PerM
MKKNLKKKIVLSLILSLLAIGIIFIASFSYEKEKSYINSIEETEHYAAIIKDKNPVELEITYNGKEDKTLLKNEYLASSQESNLNDNQRLLIAWIISLSIIGGIIITIGIAYCILFFIFGKWTIANNKPIRVFKIGRLGNKVRLIKMSCMVIYRNEEEIYKSKNDIKISE